MTDFGLSDIEFYHRIVSSISCRLKNKIVLDVSRSHGISTLLSVKANARLCVTLIDSFDEEFIRQFLRDNQADEERVEFITEVSQIDVIVDIIFTDCSDLFKLLSFNITSVIEARRRFLARGGLIIPDEHYLYLYGLWDEGLLRDTEQEWRFPFKNIDYTFLSNESPKETRSTIVRRRNVVTQRALLRQFNLHNLSLEKFRFFQAPFLLEPLEKCDSINAFFVDSEISLSLSRPDYENRLNSSHENSGLHSVFPLPKAIRLKESGDLIRGSFTVRLQDLSEIAMDLEVAFDILHPVKESHIYKIREFVSKRR